MTSEANRLVIYGASDDLIEIDGAIYEELSPPSYGKPAILTVRVDDAAFVSLRVEYDPDGSGEWRIEATQMFGGTPAIIPARGEDEGDDEDGCPGYSDKAVIFLGSIEARRIDLAIDETHAE